MRDVATLLEALPYIREFHGKTVVIKYGGAAMTDPELREEFARDVVLLKYVGLNPVVVHGGGPDITAYMKRLGLPVEFVDGLLFRAARKAAPSGEDIGFVGRIKDVRTDVLHHIAQDYIPVIASVGADREGHSYNVNADEAAGAVARALGAYKVMFLTDVRGWLRDPADPDSIITEASADEVTAALETVAGGMRPKLAACVEAINGGVSHAHIVDGRVPHSLLLELFTDAGIGTKVRPTE